MIRLDFIRLREDDPIQKQRDSSESSHENIGRDEDDLPFRE